MTAVRRGTARQSARRQHQAAARWPVAGLLEGGGHRPVLQVGVRVDGPRRGRGDQDPRDLGQDLAREAVTAVVGHDAEVADDGDVGVA